MIIGRAVTGLDVRWQPQVMALVRILKGAVAAIGVLRARLAEPWTLDVLAGGVHLSRSQLVRSFDTLGHQT
jgi:hypothetical protein